MNLLYDAPENSITFFATPVAAGRELLRKSVMRKRFENYWYTVLTLGKTPNNNIQSRSASEKEKEVSAERERERESATQQNNAKRVAEGRGKEDLEEREGNTRRKDIGRSLKR
ncbi:hypothetical protein MTO96_014562 [Rhipicephalus appendiculatus]